MIVSASVASHPNVVQIVAHDLGQHVGCYGVETVRTPRIDALAADGVRVENAFAVAPQCSPSRAAMATGRYPHNNGVMGLEHWAFGFELDRYDRHLASVLSEAGYRTALAGLQHEVHRPAAVFDDVFAPADERDRCAVADRAVAAVDWLAAADEPTYLQVGFFEPHRDPGTDSGFGAITLENSIGDVGDAGEGVPSPDGPKMTVPEYLIDEPSARRELLAFEAAVSGLDAAIGRVVDALETTGVRDETILVVTTEHGIPFPRAKCSPYDPGLETCLVIDHPAGAVRSDKTVEPPIPNVDLAPTLLDLADLPVPAWMQGRSFAPAVTGGAYRPRDAVFGELTYHDYYDPRRWVRADGYKLIVNFTAAPAFMDPSQTWRPATRPTHPEDPANAFHPPVELYNLDADPQEVDNLATSPEYEAEREALLERLHSWMLDTADPLLSGAAASPVHGWSCRALRDRSVEHLTHLYE
jgi:arylsulfatase A-like enzyme